ncbi:FeoB-associated Cys-rich membrane protein [bacterium]|nr:FeoB-associated Cys-rich membrane protein [bacterium]
MEMFEAIIVIVLVVVAAWAAVRTIRRQAAGREGCGCGHSPKDPNAPCASGHPESEACPGTAFLKDLEKERPKG